MAILWNDLQCIDRDVVKAYSLTGWSFACDLHNYHHHRLLLQQNQEYLVLAYLGCPWNTDIKRVLFVPKECTPTLIV